MEENLTSSETLQEEKPVELTEMFMQKKKTVTYGDTLTLQTTLCVLIAIGFVVINILNGGLASDILAAYKESFDSDSNIAEVLASAAEFLNTAPINNV